METGLRIKGILPFGGANKTGVSEMPLTLLLDGLYAKGPVMEICRKNKWEFMIVLKDESLSTVWSEVTGLMRLDTKGENRYKQTWQGRQQTFRCGQWDRL